MPILSPDDLANEIQQFLSISKLSSSNAAANAIISLWRNAGYPPAGTDPTSGVAGQVLTKADAGAIPFNSPAAGSLLYLARAMLSYTVAGQVILYDRLWHNSGLSASSTAVQTVNSVALPARCPVLSDPTGRTFDALGGGVEAWFQVMGVAMGAGTVAPFITYTDDQGNAGNVATLQGWSSAMGVNQTRAFELLAGDRGVRSIQSYQQTAAQSLGTFSLVLRRRIASIRLPIGNEMVVVDWAGLGMPIIPDDAHLELVWNSTATSLQSVIGDLLLVEA